MSCFVCKDHSGRKRVCTPCESVIWPRGGSPDVKLSDKVKVRGLRP